MMVMLRSSVLALAMVVSIAAVGPIQRALPPSTDDLAERAYVAIANGAQPEAIALYSEAIRRQPESFISYYRRGVSYARMGEAESALADLNNAVRLAPEVQTSNELGLRALNSLLPETHALNLVVMVRAARADVLHKLNRTRDAITDLDAAIALDPRRTSLWHTRGLLHMETGNAPAAVADFSALLARRENINWRFARGICYFANGDLAEAEEDFLRAAQIDPKNALYVHWVAKTQKARGIPI
jgi:tetratricopeptide (TPR) repeat protein